MIFLWESFFGSKVIYDFEDFLKYKLKQNLCEILIAKISKKILSQKIQNFNNSEVSEAQIQMLSNFKSSRKFYSIPLSSFLSQNETITKINSFSYRISNPYNSTILQLITPEQMITTNYDRKKSK